MTKPSAILVATQVDMRTLPDKIRDVVRWMVTEGVRGVGEEMHKRFIRVVRRIMNGGPGETFMFYGTEPRHRGFHNRWMAIEDRIYASQDFFINKEGFRDWLKTGAHWGAWYVGKNRFGGDKLIFVPASVKYENCSDDEMREFVDGATAFLRTDRAQRRLWRHLQPHQRAAMVEALMAKPGDQPE